MVILLDSELRILSINTAAIRSLGFNLTDITGKYFPDLVHEKDYITNIFRQIATGGAACGGYLTRYKTAGEPVIADSYFAVVKDKFDDMIGFPCHFKGEPREKMSSGKHIKLQKESLR